MWTENQNGKSCFVSAWGVGGEEGHSHRYWWLMVKDPYVVDVDHFHLHFPVDSNAIAAEVVVLMVGPPNRPLRSTHPHLQWVYMQEELLHSSLLLAQAGIPGAACATTSGQRERSGLVNNLQQRLRKSRWGARVVVRLRARSGRRRSSLVLIVLT